MVTEAEIGAAVRVLREGGLVAFPTETVYGLGADASNPAAVARIYAAKGRPPSHPLIVHLASSEAAEDWSAAWPTAARALAARFWPGPLTLVVRRGPRVPDEVTGGQDTVALRVPSHPVARALLEAFRGGIAAPSANRYGRVSPTRAEHVRAELGASVDLVLDGGECEVGLESTIVACLDDAVTLLRPGHVTRAEIESVTGPLAELAQAPRVPGSVRTHYAPATPLELVESEELESRLEAAGRPGPVAVLARRPPPARLAGHLWSELPADPAGFGHELYAALRKLDSCGARLILVERVPAGEAWDAARDRLSRAAARDPAETT